jgi:hypothetical protein
MSSVMERTLVTYLAGLLDVLGGDRAAVVGHDWCAALAWAVARFARPVGEAGRGVGRPSAGRDCRRAAQRQCSL